MSQEEKRYGWFSKKQKQVCQEMAKGPQHEGQKPIPPSHIWEKPDGTEVEVTWTTTDPNYEPKFDDSVCVGEVTRWLRNP
jgi:hypothetical protein